MNKINFQNLPNTTTPLNASNMNQLQTNVENAITEAVEQCAPEIITGYIDRKSYTVSQSWTAINLAPFDSYVSTTNKITLTSSGLKIGEGVSKILVSASCRGIDHSAFSGDKAFSIYKNGNRVTEIALESYITNQNSWCEQSVSPALIECEEDDVFSLYFGSDGTGTGDLLGEWLTIQVIE